MPADCNNILTITTSTPAEHQALAELLTDGMGALTFEYAVPDPDETEMPDWCLEHWGTDRNAYESSQDTGNEGQIRFTFLTAWAPPETFVQAVATQFPASTFHLEYLEVDAGIGGELIYNNGDLIWEGQDGGEMLQRKLHFGWGVDDIARDLAYDPDELAEMLDDDDETFPAEILTALMELNQTEPLGDAVVDAIKAHENYASEAA